MKYVTISICVLCVSIIGRTALAADGPATVAAAAVNGVLSDSSLPERDSADVRELIAVRRRFACATPGGVRAAVTTSTRASADVAVTLDGFGELPVTHAQAPLPANLIVRLTRVGTSWRVARISLSETALAEALIGAASATERNALLDGHPTADRIELVRQLADKGFAIDVKGEFEHAETIAGIALAIAHDGGNDDSVARAIWLRGRARDGQDRLDEAISDYEESRRLAEGSGDRETVAASLVGHGTLTMLQGDRDRGLAEVAQALEEATAVGNDSLAATALLILGNEQQYSGDYIASLRTHDEARARAERAGDRLIEAAVLANMGTTYDRMNNFDLAKYFLERGIAAYREIGNIRGVLRNLRNLADVEAEAQELENAETHLDEIDRLLVKQPNDRIRGYSALTRAKIVLRRDPEKAIQLSAVAQEKARAMDDPRLTLYANWLVARARFHQHRYEEAIALDDEVAALAKSAAVADVYWHVQTEKAAAYRRLGRLAEAREAAADAIASIEAVSLKMPANGEDATTFFNDKGLTYNEMFRVLAPTDPGEALMWTERGRSRSLLEFVARRRIVPMEELIGEESSEQSRLEARLRELNEKLLHARTEPSVDSVRVEELEKELRRAHVERDELASRLFRLHPTLALANADLFRPSFEQLRQSIPPDGAVLEYVVDEEEQSSLVIVTRDRAPRVIPIPVSQDELLRDVARFVARISSAALGVRTLSRQLYDLLLEPAESELAGKKTICFIPDGPLWGLPFQALMGRDGKYFIEKHALFYAPSATLLAWYESHPRNGDVAPRPLLAVGNPALRSDTIKLARAVQRDESLGPLPEAEREARTVASIYGGASELLTGTNATETRFKELAPQFRILHLATHGMFDDLNPMYSHVVLARKRNDADDGLVEARELIGLGLHADLVVLSGCETGRGLSRGGEGMIGMSWALLAAGCPTAVVTPMKVSESAADLMIAFHRRLAASPTIDPRTTTTALRDAQLAMLHSKRFAQPFHWAGFMLVGRGW